MMVLLDGEPSGKVGFRCKRFSKAFTLLFISVCNMWVRIRAKARGLVSKLHRNSEYLRRRSALASALDTSGAIDKCPVLAQSCRARSVRIVMFRAPAKSAWRV